MVSALAKKTINKPVYDAAGGLTWQKSGSSPRRIEKVPAYIQALNDQKYAGYSDWRLPTPEEVMSLMDPKRRRDGWLVDEVFDKAQEVIWTSDKYAASRAWYVSFLDGLCYYVGFDSIYGVVRAVR